MRMGSESPTLRSGTSEPRVPRSVPQLERGSVAPTPLSRSAVIGLGAVGIVGTGIAIAVSPVAGMAVAAAGLVAVGLYLAPYYVGLSLVAWGVVRVFITGALGVSSSYAGSAEIVAVIALALTALPRLPRHYLLKDRPTVVLVMAVVASLLASAFVNGSSALGMIWGLRSLFLLPVIAVATSVLSESERERQAARYVAVGCAVVQLPFGLVQYLRPPPSGVGAIDRVFGTTGYGTANLLGLLMALLVAVGIAYAVRTRSLWGFVLTLGFLGMVLITGSRLGLLLLPVFLLIVLLGRSAGSPLRLRLAAVALVLVLGGVGFVAYSIDNPSMRYTSLVRLLRAQLVVSDSYSSARLGGLAFAIRYLGNAAPVPLLGTGPASAGAGGAKTLGGQVARRFDTTFQLTAQGQQESSTYQFPPPGQLATSIVQYGPLGVLFYVLFLLRVGWLVAKRLRMPPVPEMASRVFLISLAFVTLGSLYGYSWEGFSLFAVCFWWWVMAMSPDALPAAG
jgi:hypothetical protein